MIESQTKGQPQRPYLSVSASKGLDCARWQNRRVIKTTMINIEPGNPSSTSKAAARNTCAKTHAGLSVKADPITQWGSELKTGHGFWPNPLSRAAATDA